MMENKTQIYFRAIVNGVGLPRKSWQALECVDSACTQLALAMALVTSTDVTDEWQACADAFAAAAQAKRALFALRASEDER